MIISLFWGFIFAFTLNANQTHAPDTKEKEPPKDTPFLSEQQKQKVILENLIFTYKKIEELPEADKSKPIARTENSAVEKTVEKNAEAEARNRRAQEVAFFPAEVTTFPAKDAQQAIREVITGGKIDEGFLNFTKQYRNIDQAVKVLEKTGGIDEKAPSVVSTQEAAALVLDENPARLAYLAAAYKFQQDMMKKTEPRDLTAETQQSIQDSGARLGSSFNLGQKSGYTLPHGTLPKVDLASLSGGYLDLAAKQIVNAGSRLPSDSSSLSSPFTAGTEINKLFTEALNAANRLDISSNNMSEQVKPFKDLIQSKAFLENGEQLLGKDNFEALVSAVQSADLLNAAEGNVSGTSAEYLGGAFNLGTGIASPPCIGCVEIKGSPIVKAAGEYAIAEESISAEAQLWIDEAKELSDQASRNKSLFPKQVAALMKGRLELDKLLQTLELYRSLGLLNLVKVPMNYSMSRYYKDGAELAAGILFRVQQKKIKSSTLPAAQANIKKVKASASQLLQKMKEAKTPASMENALRSFFEKEEYNEVRALWRDYEMVNYRKLRSLTAQVIMSRSLAALKLPSFERVTVERASLAYLVNKSFASLKEHEERLLKERQKHLGILKLPGIKMADEKEKEKQNKKPENQEVKRFPSFSEE